MLSLYRFPRFWIILTLKSTPMVADDSSGPRKTSSVNRSSRDDLPTEDEPMRRSLSVWGGSVDRLRVGSWGGAVEGAATDWDGPALGALAGVAIANGEIGVASVMGRKTVVRR